MGHDQGTATVEWLNTVLAEEALGGPAALTSTSLQRVAGAATRVVNLPNRVAVSGVNRYVTTVQRTAERDGNADAAQALHETRSDLGAPKLGAAGQGLGEPQLDRRGSPRSPTGRRGLTPRHRTKGRRRERRPFGVSGPRVPSRR